MLRSSSILAWLADGQVESAVRARRVGHDVLHPSVSRPQTLCSYVRMFFQPSGASSSSTAHSGRAPAVQPWVEKYRPPTIDDIAHQDEVVKTLKNAIQTATLPHMLMYGPPGTGKTSTILAVAKCLFGPEYRSRILELNASDERGIKVVREKVKQFAQFSVTNLEKVSGYPCPPFKIVILDEADTMTSEAQAALRRTMETHSKITRFCLVCNYVTRIIEPLASRCAKFRFRPLSRDTMLDRLHTIAKAEKAEVKPELLDAILTVAGGDMRKAVTTLQSVHHFYGKMEAVSPNAVREIAGDVPDDVITRLLAAIKSDSFNNLQAEVDNVGMDGYPTLAVLNRLFDAIVEDDNVDDVTKAQIGLRLGKAEKLLVDGASEALQLMDVTAHMMREMAAGRANAMAM